MCIKWRSIARAFLPLEILNFILINAIPWEGCTMDQFSYGCKTFCLGVFFYTDIKIGLLTLLIGGVVQICIRIVKEWAKVGSGDSAEMIIMILGAVCMIVLMSASLLRHLAWLQKRLRLQMSEYSNLINRISEGVLVLVRE